MWRSIIVIVGVVGQLWVVSSRANALGARTVLSQGGHSRPAVLDTDKLPRSSALGASLAFEPNRGQFDRRVLFAARSGGYTAFLTSAGVTLAPTGPTERFRGWSRGSGPVREPFVPTVSNDSRRTGVTPIALTLLGASGRRSVRGFHRLPGIVNYLIGNNPRHWHTHIPRFKEVEYTHVYPGISLVFYGADRGLEYDWRVQPGANPDRIAMTVSGARSLHLDATGSLLAETASGVIREAAPIVYQVYHGQRRTVRGAFALARSRLTFRIGQYDRSRPLVIDPSIRYSSIIGHSGYDNPGAVATDSQGNAYITGSTSTSDFPVTSALRKHSAGELDAFVTKVNAAGNALVYSTYLGGSVYDAGNGVAVDTLGNAYVTGLTTSKNFPTKVPLQAQLHGSTDAFLAKLTQAGDGLEYSTYLGGSKDEYSAAVAVGPDQVAVVVGQTTSTDFPRVHATQGSRVTKTCQGQPYPCPDAFVTSVAPNGQSIIYSTPLGGGDADSAGGVALDQAGNAVVVGSTSSTDFPVTCISPPLRNQGGDGFVVRLNPQGAPLFSRYLGGDSYEYLSSVAIDGLGHTYVTGQTGASTGLLPPGGFQGQNAGSADVFVEELDANGASLAGTYLGGAGSEYGSNIAVSGTGNVYVAGTTASSDFPTARPLQPKFGGGTCAGGADSTTPCSDAFVSELDGSLKTLIFSTYLGRNDNDGAAGIAVDPTGQITVLGSTHSWKFPTVHPLAPYTGAGTIFLMKIDTSTPPATFKMPGAAPTTFKIVSVRIESLTAPLDWTRSTPVATKIDRQQQVRLTVYITVQKPVVGLPYSFTVFIIPIRCE